MRLPRRPRHTTAAPVTIIRCAYCREEVAPDALQCLYCGTNLSDPLATTIAVRPEERSGSFSEDTPAGFISGTGTF
jgi:hypothetical protein